MSLHHLTYAQIFNTAQGPVKAEQRNGLWQIDNIPYAQPPVGKLRWKAPLPPVSREVVWDGKSVSDNMSVQIRNQVVYSEAAFGTVVGSEDCLYLDITTHLQTDRVRPVIVWIHGGSNKFGTKSDEMYESSVLAMNTDAVIVKVNYRLGIMGSLYLPELSPADPESASGNYTLLDLIQALRWTQQNIREFGGDPTNITLMGESAGTINIWNLLLSSLAKGLFHKVICSSGMPLIVSKDKAQKRSREALIQLLIKAHVVSNDKEGLSYLKSVTHEQLSSFLAGLDVTTIVEATKDLTHQSVDDGYTLKSHGFWAVNRARVGKIPMITGTTQHEASYFLVSQYTGISYAAYWRSINQGERQEKVTDFVASKAYKSYWKKVVSRTRLLRFVVDFHNRRYASHCKSVYMYRFEALPIHSPWKQLFGATHASDLIYLFGKEKFIKESFFKFLEPNTELELEIFRKQVGRLHTYIRNFIYTGNPAEVGGNHWPVWNKRKGNILYITNQEMATR